MQQLVRLRWCGIALGAAAVALSIPGPAGANTLPVTLFSATVTKNAGFKLSFTAGGTSKSGTISLSLNKTSKTSSQLNAYIFSGLSYTAASDLSTATIKGTFAKGRGSVNETFTATHPAKTVPVPKGCHGTPGKKRNGTLKGSLTLKADKLGTEKLSSVAGYLLQPPNIKRCSGGHVSHGTTVSGRRGAASAGATKPAGKGLVSEYISMFQSGNGFAFFHTFTAIVPRADYTFASNLSTASLKGANGISGSASYKGSAASHGLSSGTLTGDMSVTMATIGKVKPFAHGSLSAHQSTY